MKSNEPSIDAPRSFLRERAQAAERIGFILMRVTPALFDQSLMKRDGLGLTGQVIAAGPDGLLRSTPSFGGRTWPLTVSPVCRSNLRICDGET